MTFPRFAPRLLGLLLVPLVVQAQASDQPPTRADSIVLERSACFGVCPAYRLTVRASGLLSVAPLAGGPSASSASVLDSPNVLPAILRELGRNGFFELPAISLGSPPLCRVAATDAATLSVMVFDAARIHEIRYYLGCIGTSPTLYEARPFTQRLRAIADGIDSISRSSRLLRPGGI